MSTEISSQNKEQTDISDFLKNEELKIKEPKESKIIDPIYLPFKSIDENNIFSIKEEEPFIMQFPRIIPFDLNSQLQSKSNELEENEEILNNNEQVNKEQHFKNSFKELPNGTKIGKLKVYKSGKMTLTINDIEFDVTTGIPCTFKQELFVENKNQGYILSKIKNEKLIVHPKV